MERATRARERKAHGTHIRLMFLHLAAGVPMSPAGTLPVYDGVEIVRDAAFRRPLIVGSSFDSIDGEEVRFIFLLVGKDSMLNLHIKLLSRISRLMNKDEFREKLLKSESKEAALKLFVEEEQSYLDI